MNITQQHREHIEASLRDKYEKVAAGAPGQFRYPTGETGLEALGYQRQWYERLPRPVRDCFCGVGNPFAMGLPANGDCVLDVGCGCGVDALLSAGFVGPLGKAVGLESSQAMLAKARDNARTAGVVNAEFIDGNAESLPFENDAFDVITSSGVYNLVIDKKKALDEAFRVLKPGGRLQVADQILTGPTPLSVEDMVVSWFT
jgi:SAM-dependent methyltransferase